MNSSWPERQHYDFLHDLVQRFIDDAYPKNVETKPKLKNPKYILKEIAEYCNTFNIKEKYGVRVYAYKLEKRLKEYVN